MLGKVCCKMIYELIGKVQNVIEFSTEPEGRGKEKWQSSSSSIYNNINFAT